MSDSSEHLLIDDVQIQPLYGSTSDVQTSFIQRRRSSMNSERFIRLNLASSVKNGEFQPVNTDLQTETIQMLYAAVPLITTFILQYSLTVSSIFFVGNIGADELAAVSLANLMANITAFGPIEGITSALSTLCPQAYGRKDYKSVGLHAMRCLLLLLLLWIPNYILWTYGSFPLLSMIVPEVQACKLAAKYLSVLIWGIPGFIVFEVLKQYLQAQGIFHASTVVLFVFAPLNVLLTYAMVFNKTIGMGFIGAPMAVVITDTLMAVMLLCYTCFINGYQCWCGFSMDYFRRWSRMLKLAGPGIVMILAEWLAYEVISIMAARFGTEALAAQSVITTICVTVYQIPFAISVAGSTRVAWFIGSSSKSAAITSTKAVLIISLIFTVLNVTVISVFRYQISSLFSTDLAVIALSSQVLIIGALYQIPDCLAAVLGGVLRGQGKQYIGGYLNLFSYYILALPLSFILGFYFDFELMGLWWGLSSGVSFTAIYELFYIINTDWDKVIKNSLDEELRNNPSLTDPECDPAALVTPSSLKSSVVDYNPINPTINLIPEGADRNCSKL